MEAMVGILSPALTDDAGNCAISMRLYTKNPWQQCHGFFVL